MFHLAEDIQQQAAIYWNIIERLKLGSEAGAIRSTFEKLGLVPKDTLPNPANDRLLNFALGRISKFRRALLRLVRDYGGRFIQELRLEGSSAISVGAQLGLPPSISISVEYSLQAVAEDRWTTQRTSSDPRRSE